MSAARIVRVAALSAAIAIAAGAFGAHGAGDQAKEWLRTGATYQLPHAIAAIALARLDPRVSWVLLGSAAVFAFSLYAMALGAPRWFGAIAPLGGAAMIGGWLWLAYGARLR
ncbi:DUF423 domain-containing protein [Sphingomonas sp. SUN039]|uniref:DUF423 domain-containing protein n=1 Tax=Sphingomonas sp. SUN039 TaxID=2937787 RepID=UPI00216462E5|nr:DUF423 domain-containing protein [Sphingomonas sp. SUN039]UVO53449.1 DUF423 domain-containing protein [Sphingomonas sp. SUN039]